MALEASAIQQPPLSWQSEETMRDPSVLHEPAEARDPRARPLRKTAAPLPGDATPDPARHAELLVAERGAGPALELAELYADLTRSRYWHLVEAAVRRIIGPC
jgi:hypothetical protein